MSEDQQDWRQQARCRNTDPETMQPEVATEAAVREALAVCKGCPVMLQCKALAESQEYGAYGVHAGRWYGEQPRRPHQERCGHCERPMDPNPRARSTRRFCSGNCRLAAHRAARRRAGVVGA